MRGDKLVSVVIPTFNRFDKLRRLLDSIHDSEVGDYRLEVIVVDDASTDRDYEDLHRLYGWVNVIRNDKERHLAGTRNRGIAASHGEYVFLVDDDNVLDGRCIRVLADAMQVSGTIGMAVPYMHYLSRRDTVWCGGASVSRRLFTPFIDGNVSTGRSIRHRCDAAPNAFMLSRDAIDAVGLFDEANFPIHHLEADYAIRLRLAGFMATAIPEAITYHDIRYEGHFDLDIRHDKRPYNIMYGETMLRRKWERSRFWRFAAPLMILQAMGYIIVRSTKVEPKDKAHYWMMAWRGYRAGSKVRLVK